MKVRLSLSLAVLAAVGCARKVDGPASEGSGSDEGTQTSLSSSSESAGESGTETESSSGSESSSETETGEDEPVDACPASPVLDSLSATFDGWAVGYEYPEQAHWNEPCIVTAHTGALDSGESITLACVDAEGQAIEHVIEIQAKLADAEQPTAVSVSVGESVQLTLWSRVWFAGGAAWALRDPEQLDDIRLLYYSSIELPDPADTGFSPTPDFVAPLEITIQDGLCDVYCPEPDAGGGFVPPGECSCEREQGLELVHGPDTTVIQNGSAAPIGASMFAFVKTAMVFPNDGGCPDHSDAWYTFLLVEQ